MTATVFARKDCRHGGFTLLEMLFVMFVIGLLVSLTIPRFAAGLQQREWLAQRSDIEDQLRELPRRVRLSAHPVQLPADLKLADLGDGMPPLRLALGWGLAFDPPLQVSMLGACAASTVVLTQQEDPTMGARYRIAALSCELSDATP